MAASSPSQSRTSNRSSGPTSHSTEKSSKNLSSDNNFIPCHLPVNLIVSGDTAWNVGPIIPILDQYIKPQFYPVHNDARHSSPFVTQSSSGDVATSTKSDKPITRGTRELYESVKSKLSISEKAVEEYLQYDDTAGIAYLDKCSEQPELVIANIPHSRSFWLDANQPSYRLDYRESMANPKRVPVHIRTEIDFRCLEGVRYYDDGDGLMKERYSRFFIVNKAEHMLRINGIEIDREGIAGPLPDFSVIELGDNTSILFWGSLESLDFEAEAKIFSSMHMSISDKRVPLRPPQEEIDQAVKDLKEKIRNMFGDKPPVPELARAMGYETPPPDAQ